MRLTGKGKLFDKGKKSSDDIEYDLRYGQETASAISDGRTKSEKGQKDLSGRIKIVGGELKPKGILNNSTYILQLDDGGKFSVMLDGVYPTYNVMLV